MAELADLCQLKLVVLTRGGEGSLLFAGGRYADHSGRKVEIVDAVGAGDAFTAATVVGWLAGKSLEEMNAAASEVAAYVCTQAGATPPLPQDLKKLFW
jgi:fructokinase